MEGLEEVEDWWVGVGALVGGRVGGRGGGGGPSSQSWMLEYMAAPTRMRRSMRRAREKLGMMGPFWVLSGTCFYSSARRSPAFQLTSMLPEVQSGLTSPPDPATTPYASSSTSSYQAHADPQTCRSPRPRRCQLSCPGMTLSRFWTSRRIDLQIEHRWVRLGSKLGADLGETMHSLEGCRKRMVCVPGGRRC